MIKQTKVSSVQLIFLVVGSMLMFPYTFSPVINAPPANQDSWIVVFMSVIYFTVLSIPLLFIINKFRGLSFNDTIEIILGKIAGKIASFIILLFFVFCYVACFMMGIIFIKSFIFPETPSWALAIFILAPAAFAAFKGAGTIARLAIFIFPYIILTILFFFVLGIPQMDISILQPILKDSKFLELNFGAFLTGSRYSEILVFFVFSQYLDKDVSINKTFFKVIIIFSVLYSLIVLPTLLVLGIDIAKHAWNPYYLYTKQVKAYEFVQRMESLNTLAWILGIFTKLTLYSFMACKVLSGVFKTKSHKTFVIPLAILAFIATFIPIMNDSSFIILLRSDTIFPWIVFFTVFIVPVFIVVVYFIRKKKIKAKLLKNKEN